MGVGLVAFLMVLLKGHRIRTVIIVYRSLGCRLLSHALAYLTLYDVPAIACVYSSLVSHGLGIPVPHVREAELLFPELLCLSPGLLPYAALLMYGLIALLASPGCGHGPFCPLSRRSHEAFLGYDHHAEDKYEYEYEICSYGTAEGSQGVGYGTAYRTSSKPSGCRALIMREKCQSSLLSKQQLKYAAEHEYAEQGAHELERGHEMTHVADIEPYRRYEEQR